MRRTVGRLREFPPVRRLPARTYPQLFARMHSSPWAGYGDAMIEEHPPLDDLFVVTTADELSRLL